MKFILSLSLERCVCVPHLSKHSLLVQPSATARQLSSRDDGVPVSRSLYWPHSQAPLADGIWTALVPFQPVLVSPYAFGPVIRIVSFFSAGYPVHGVRCSYLGPASAGIPSTDASSKDFGEGVEMWRCSNSLAFGPRRSTCHINGLEVEAVFRSMQTFIPALCGKATTRQLPFMSTREELAPSPCLLARRRRFGGVTPTGLPFQTDTFPAS